MKDTAAGANPQHFCACSCLNMSSKTEAKCKGDESARHALLCGVCDVSKTART